MIYDVEFATDYKIFHYRIESQVCSILAKSCKLLKMLKMAFLQLFPKFGAIQNQSSDSTVGSIVSECRLGKWS